jgi:pyruvate/2-oxoglutarate dehydrogenase complex dihydrolipoamide acyltransferase (E2) component
MKIVLTLTMDEPQLRRVRTATGRGGKATRADVRIWASRVLQEALQEAPTPKLRRPKGNPPAPAPEAPTAPLAAPQPPRAEVTDETRCRHCRRRRENHGLMSQTCPPVTGGRVGARFSPAEET